MAIFKPEKQYTEHALMDEVVYNTQLILTELVVKNQDLADKYETQEIVNDAEIYMLCMNGNITFDIFPFSEKILRAYGITDISTINSYVHNKENIPNSMRKSLMEFAKKYYIDNYVEKNMYYRALNGLPPINSIYDTTITVEKEWFPYGYDISTVDFSLKLHEQPKKVISILSSSGAIDRLIDNTYGKGLKYMYLRFLGSKKISIYDARKAGKWDIIYMPHKVENLVSDRFEELYNINKTIYLNRHYQEAYAFDSDYYDELSILMVLCETFNNMITDTPEWYIRRDIFDIRSVQYFLSAYGVRYFKDIPLRYQIRIVKNLNKLIKYKSTDKNFKDILEVFSVPNTDIYKYYLFKHRKFDKRAQEYTDDFNLEFIQVKLDDFYDDYIKDSNNRTPYDEITYADQYWDGVDSHDYIRRLHKELDFSVQRTKYYSIDYKVSAKEFNFQTEYFLGLLMSTEMSSDDVQISVPCIDEEATFALSDLFLLIFCFNNKYYNFEHTIRRPEDNRPKFEGKEYFRDIDGGYPGTDESEYLGFNNMIDGVNPNKEWLERFISADGGSPESYNGPIVEEFYTWMKKYFKEIYQDIGKRRVYGFNLKADLSFIEMILNQAHSSFNFEDRYTLEDLGIAEYISIWKIAKVKTLNQLYQIYETNKKCYDNLYHKIIYECNNMDEYRLFKFIFDYLFTVPFDDKYYGEFINLEDVLKDRDYTLYWFYHSIADNGTDDIGSRDLIRTALDQINDTLEYYIKNHNVDYVLNNSAISSFFDIVTYIHHLLDFFKSFKAQFLDPYDTRVFDDQMDNFARPNDVISEMQVHNWVRDKQFVRDKISYIQVELEFNDRPYHDNIWERMDLMSFIEFNPLDDYDYDGSTPSDDSPFKDADGGKEDHEDTNVYPYYILDGGKPQLGMKNLWDLDGGSAEDPLEYLDVDGGKPYYARDIIPEGNHFYIPEDYEAGRVSQPPTFTYILDGGTPGTNTFMSRTMITRVEDRSIKQDVMISNSQYNKLKLNPDGIVVEQQWATWVDFNEWKGDFDAVVNDAEDLVENLNFLLEIVADPDALQRRVDNCIDNVLHGLRYSAKKMDGDALEKSIIQHSDDRRNQTGQDIISINPFEWEEIELR